MRLYARRKGRTLVLRYGERGRFPLANNAEEARASMARGESFAYLNKNGNGITFYCVPVLVNHKDLLDRADWSVVEIASKYTDKELYAICTTRPKWAGD